MDGIVPWEGETANSFAIRARAEQYNNIYLTNILFWAYQLSGGKESFELRVDGEPVARVSGVPLTVEAAFSVRSSALPARKKT